MIWKITILVLVLAAAPLGTGLLINNRMPEEDRGIGSTYLMGFLCLLAVFQLITVPVVFLDAFGFPKVILLFSCAAAVLSCVGIVETMHLFREEKVIWRKKKEISIPDRTQLCQWITVAAVIGFQLIMAVVTASFDGDDAYYVVNSVITDETDTLYRILPYTGLSTSLDLRHSMAVFPIWIAYVARLSKIHATILSHSILPVVFISITYGIYYQIGKKLLYERKKLLPVYMLFIAFLHMFGNTSIYTNATFLIMRNWQGKSMLANVVIPSIFLVLLWLFEGERRDKDGKKVLWFLLFILNIVAAMMSTASVFLNSVLIGVMALVLTVEKKDLKILVKLFFCCIPCVVYALLYVLL